MKTSGINSNFLISKLIDLLFYIEVEKRLTFNKNLGLFGLIPAWSGCFGPISEVSCFDPIGAGRFGPISKVGCFGPIFWMSHSLAKGLEIYIFIFSKIF
ncbi:MAG: hypothetical protein AB2766_21410 [Candidatus Thiodiazotropha endolucinida]